MRAELNSNLLKVFRTVIANEVNKNLSNKLIGDKKAVWGQLFRTHS